MVKILKYVKRKMTAVTKTINIHVIVKLCFEQRDPLYDVMFLLCQKSNVTIIFGHYQHV